MLPRVNRIKKKKDFEAVFKEARKAPQSLKSNLFILKVAKNNLGLNRLGIMVSQKVSKKAVERNKVRRRAINAIKDEIKNIKAGTDLVLIALPGIEKKGFAEIKESIHNICLHL